MGLIRVRWGKLYVELPGEVFLVLLFRAFLMLPQLNV